MSFKSQNGNKRPQLITLSIAIPTFNRAASLEKMLRNVATQLNAFPSDGIELLVSDNHSTDHTELLARNFGEFLESSTYRYIRQPRNVGFDANVDGLLRTASGEFTWVISDDDLLNENAIRTVYEIIIEKRQRDINYIFVNYDILKDYKSYSSDYVCSRTKVLAGREVFDKVTLSNTFISSNIYRTKSWTALNTRKFFGSLWVHMLVAREILQNGNALLVGASQITMFQSSLERSRLGKADEAEYVDMYTMAHFNLCKFVRELSLFAYDTSTISRLSKYCVSGEVGHIINLKLSLRDNERARCDRFWSLLVESRMNGRAELLLKWVLLRIPSGVFKAAKAIKGIF